MIGWTYCSGLLTAELSAPQIDWRLASEIAALPREIALRKAGFACARRGGSDRVLWPDFTAFRARHARRLGIPFPDIIVAGTPCQSFSLAGLKRGLSDPRGQLTLEFVRHVRFLQSVGLRWLVWENVPGVLGHPDNPFGCFLSGIIGGDLPLRPPRGRLWPNAGMVAGPRARACWRVLGAEYFGVPQRRARVFVVVGLGDDCDPAAALFERQSGIGHSKTRPKAGQEIAPTVSARTRACGGLGTDFDLDGGLIAERGGRRIHPTASGDRAMGELGRFARADAGRGRGPREDIAGHHGDIAGTVSAKWEKGTGGPAGDEGQNLIAFSAKDCGGDAGSLSPTVRALNFDKSHPNSGGQVAIAFKASHFTRGKDGAPSDLAFAQSADTDKGDQDQLICAAWDSTQITHPENRSTLDFGGPGLTHSANAHPMSIVGLTPASSTAIVRRITARECERLFGLPDDWTLLDLGKANRDIVERAATARYFLDSGYSWADAWQLSDVPDGPRFRHLGNAMARPVIGWILGRITEIENAR